MRRPLPNPFTLLLGATGVLFTVTAASYCLSVLRQTRGVDADQPPHPLLALMDTHGTSILMGQLALLAIATFGSIAVDHAEGVRIRRERGQRPVPSPAAPPPHDGAAGSGSAGGGGG